MGNIVSNLVLCFLLDIYFYGYVYVVGCLICMVIGLYRQLSGIVLCVGNCNGKFVTANS